MFRSYDKIPESARRWTDDEAALRRLHRLKWVATEKIHGANFCFLLDGDGVRDDRFSFATLNANLVARWEMWPGSTLMAVYTRAQRHDRLADRLAYAGLRTGATQEILLLKLTLFRAN